MADNKSITRTHRLAGLTHEEEVQHLADTIEIAQTNLEHAKEQVRQLDENLADMMEAYDTRDKEVLVLWNNATAQMKETKREITRYEKARSKPYFGRIDFREKEGTPEETCYIGRVGIANQVSEPEVIDWRAPIASVYYESSLGPSRYTVSSEGVFELDLTRKRTYEIENDTLKDYFDSDVVANDELLTKYLSRNKNAVLGEIIATIQEEQNRIIRRTPKTSLIVQGAAGSGKTTVAMHRISYILYNYPERFRPEDFYIIGSNRILLNYITSVLPELDVYGIRQMTMEQLFIRLLYEDWDDNTCSVRSIDKTDERNSIKGSIGWFRDLEKYCRDYEYSQIRHEDIHMEKTGHLMIDAQRIDSYLQENPQMSMQSKFLMLNEILYAKYENEIQGKHVLFTKEELKLLDKKYRFYFGKDAWKGSVFDLYHDFLIQQKTAGHLIDIPEHAFDVYDLAALAYLYKRIKEIDPIREASHIVIDEAQDFGMMAYACLNYCIRGCTYTIMGDTSQNIHFHYGLNDWEDLKQLLLEGTNGVFGLLRKSYRNTVEISQFASEILRHGDFSIYPIEPIIRHGYPVRIDRIRPQQDVIAETASQIRTWQIQGYETIAVITRNEEEAALVSSRLKQHISILEEDPETAEFRNGVMVLPVAYTKGLEFDAVLLYDPTEEKYPADNGHVKLLYVASTRALHELSVICEGSLTPLIASRAPEDKHLEEFTLDKFALREEPERRFVTEKERIAEEIETGIQEMAERRYIGPKRISANTNSGSEPAYRVVSSSRMSNRGQTGLSAQNASSARKIPNDFPSSYSPSNAPVKPLQKPAAPDNARINPSPFAYGSIADTSVLRVKGHSSVNTAIKWVKKAKNGMEVASAYGLLRLVPIRENCIRISFVKGMNGKFRGTCWKPEADSTLKWNAKESPSAVEMTTGKLIIHMEKKDGAMQFLSSDRKPLVSERSKEPRLIEGSECWSFFTFDKKEKLKTKGILASDLTEVNNKARYMSFGGKSVRMPLLISGKGYGIGVASEKTVLFCGLPSYGPYIYTEGMEQIDYYFISGGTEQEILDLYKEISVIAPTR